MSTNQKLRLKLPGSYSNANKISLVNRRLAAAQANRKNLVNSSRNLPTRIGSPLFVRISRETHLVNLTFFSLYKRQ